MRPDVIREYQPKVSREAYPPEFAIESDFDYTPLYPCGVCGREFYSRTELAQHPHPKKKVNA